MRDSLNLIQNVLLYTFSQRTKRWLSTAVPPMACEMNQLHSTRIEDKSGLRSFYAVSFNSSGSATLPDISQESPKPRRIYPWPVP